MVTLSWDLFITLFFIIAVVYGFILQKDKLTVLLISTYVALAVASAWGEGLYRILTSNTKLLGSWASNASLFTVEVGIFILLILLITLRGGLTTESETREGAFSPFLMAFLGFLTAGLILSSIFSFMPETAREGLIVSSRLALFVWKYHLWFIVLPPLVLVVVGSIKKIPKI